MKIEIGESLIFSWLRHVMGCPIAQTNWKPSPTWPIRREAGLAGDLEIKERSLRSASDSRSSRSRRYNSLFDKPRSTCSVFGSAILAPLPSPST